MPYDTKNHESKSLQEIASVSNREELKSNDEENFFCQDLRGDVIFSIAQISRAMHGAMYILRAPKVSGSCTSMTVRQHEDSATLFSKKSFLFDGFSIVRRYESAGLFVRRNQCDTNVRCFRIM